jgi:hypothetical protein
MEMMIETMDGQDFIRIDLVKQLLESKISRRDYFAGLAMQGMCANNFNCDHPDILFYIVQTSFKLADAMIEASKEKEKNERHHKEYLGFIKYLEGLKS